MGAAELDVFRARKTRADPHGGRAREIWMQAAEAGRQEEGQRGQPSCDQDRRRHTSCRGRRPPSVLRDALAVRRGPFDDDVRRVQGLAWHGRRGRQASRQVPIRRCRRLANILRLLQRGRRHERAGDVQPLAEVPGATGPRGRPPDAGRGFAPWPAERVARVGPRPRCAGAVSWADRSAARRGPIGQIRSLGQHPGAPGPSGADRARRRARRGPRRGRHKMVGQRRGHVEGGPQAD